MNWTVTLLCLLAATAVLAVPPPPTQVTADCEFPTYASDILVCDDDALLELDSALATRIAERTRQLPAGSENDEEWFRRSRLCAFETDHRDCLVTAYCQRVKALDSAAMEERIPESPMAYDDSLLRTCDEAGVEMDVRPAASVTIE